MTSDGKNGCVPPLDLRWLRPIGLLGALIAIAGGVVTWLAAQRADWNLVAVGAVALGVGGLIVLGGRRRTGD